MYAKHILENAEERCTSPFGARTITVNGRTIYGHSGMDFVPEDYVITPEAGEVTKIKTCVKGIDTSGYNDYGNYVYVKVSETYTLFFAHLKYNSICVKVGDKLKAGARVGFMGSTGYSTGIHCHFGLLKNGEWIDPAPFMNGKLTIVDKSTPKPAPKHTPVQSICKGDFVTINSGACWYKSEAKVPSFCIGEKYIVSSVAADNVHLDADGLNSRVAICDVTKVEAKKEETIKVGSKVKVKSTALIYGTSKKFADFVYLSSSTFDILGIDNDRVRIGIGSAVTGDTYLKDVELI